MSLRQKLSSWTRRLRTSGPTDDRYWFSRYSKSLVFLILVLTGAGAYLAFTIPISVFPQTDFPRVVIGVDNGVMPIDQMMVTITRPIEKSVNSVPGLQQVRSITSRGSAEIDLFFDWHVDMVRRCNWSMPRFRMCGAQLPATANIETHRLTLRQLPHHRVQPHLRHGAANAALDAGDLRAEAAAEPARWRCHGNRAGWAGAGIPHHARSSQTAGSKRNCHRHSRRRAANEPHRLARTAARRITNSISR